MSKERNGIGKSLIDLPANVVRSIFRNPLPSSDRGRAATSFTNFFLHIQPVRVSRRALRPGYTMGLGLISFFLFIILTVTGILLMFYYVPSTTQAYDRMLDLRSSVAFGVILRNMHRWAAHGMVACVFLHLCRVFFTGAYKAPREFNWLVGVALFLLTLFSSFTGYLLPWDQLAFWAITVGTSIAGYAPVIGKGLKFILLGDATVGQEALLRFYVLHVVCWSRCTSGASARMAAWPNRNEQWRRLLRASPFKSRSRKCRYRFSREVRPPWQRGVSRFKDWCAGRW
jgi:hypothetical protein